MHHINVFIKKKKVKKADGQQNYVCFILEGCCFLYIETLYSYTSNAWWIKMMHMQKIAQGKVQVKNRIRFFIYIWNNNKQKTKFFMKMWKVYTKFIYYKTFFYMLKWYIILLTGELICFEKGDSQKNTE